MANGKRYDRYVDDVIVNSHRYIDCDHAVCRNCHEMNIHIIKGVLSECANLVESLFTAAPFSFEACMELKRIYDTSESLPITGKHRVYKPFDVPPLSFGCNFTHEQMAGIVSCANTYPLFCMPACVEDMEALFACKEGFRIRVNNIRHVVVLFDTLVEDSLTQSRWQAVLDKGRFLRSKDGTRFISASSLSSARSVARSNAGSVALAIKKAVTQLKR